MDLCDLFSHILHGSFTGTGIVIIGSDNGLAPDWRQAIIWTNADCPVPLKQPWRIWV